MEIKFLTPSELRKAENKSIAEQLGFNKKDLSGFLSDFKNGFLDSDFVKSAKDSGKGIMWLELCKNNETEFILINKKTDKHTSLITSFLKSENIERIEDTWISYEKNGNIAYRGGAGYSYAILKITQKIG